MPPSAGLSTDKLSLEGLELDTKSKGETYDIYHLNWDIAIRTGASTSKIDSLKTMKDEALKKWERALEAENTLFVSIEVWPRGITSLIEAE
jgi:hypothetical protein